jgi:Lysine methyltransferase
MDQTRLWFWSVKIRSGNWQAEGWQRDAAELVCTQDAPTLPLFLPFHLLIAAIVAMPEMTRTWLVNSCMNGPLLAFSIREPPLTGDNLGLKTWGTAFTMAKKLEDLGTMYFSHLFNEQALSKRVLELGSGTGLVGIAAAGIWGVPVLLTDLPEIEANLCYNALQNAQVVEAQGGHIDSMVLDWKTPSGLAGQEFEV